VFVSIMKSICVQTECVSHMCVHSLTFLMSVTIYLNSSLVYWACHGVIVCFLCWSDIVQLSWMLPILIKNPFVPTVCVCDYTSSELFFMSIRIRTQHVTNGRGGQPSTSVQRPALFDPMRVCVRMYCDRCAADTLIYCFIAFAKMFLTSALDSVCMSFNSLW